MSEKKLLDENDVDNGSEEKIQRLLVDIMKRGGEVLQAQQAEQAREAKFVRRLEWVLFVSFIFLAVFVAIFWR